MTVLESNALGNPISGLQSRWTQRRAAAAAAARAAAAVDGGGQRTVLVVVAAATDGVALDGGLVPGSALDGTTLAAGDIVLLAAQRDPADNGAWVVPDIVGLAPRRPAGYANVTGNLFVVRSGATHAGRLFACTAAGTIRTCGGGDVDAVARTVDGIAAAYVSRSDLEGAMRRAVVYATPPYAALVRTDVTRAWVNRCTIYAPMGPPPTDCVQTLNLAVVLAEGEEVEVVNGSAFPLTIVAPIAGSPGPGLGAGLYLCEQKKPACG